MGPKVDKFLDELVTRDIAEESVSKRKRVLEQATDRAALQLELAMVMDLQMFVTTAYNLEGDGLFILQA